MEGLNAVVEIRLRLRASGQLASLNNAWKMLPELVPKLSKRTTLAPVHRRRVQREPFLYAAKRVAPEFLAMNFDRAIGRSKFITAEGLVSQIEGKASDRDAFRKLCSAAKAIAPVIDVEWSEEVANALDSVEPLLPELEPIPAELLPEKMPRRAATETKKTSR